jgi:hypothetical protein
MSIVSHLHYLFNPAMCQAYIHTLRWQDRPLQCPRCQTALHHATPCCGSTLFCRRLVCVSGGIGRAACQIAPAPEPPETTWYPTCHPHSQHALGAHVSLPLVS